MFRHVGSMFGVSDEVKEDIHRLDQSELDGSGPAPHISKVGRKLLGASAKYKRNRAAFWLAFDPSEPQPAKKHYYDVDDGSWLSEDVVVQIDKEPFGRGAIRECFRMSEEEQTVGRKSFARQVSGVSDSGMSEASPLSRQTSPASDCDGSPSHGKDSRDKVWVAKRAISGHADIGQHKADCFADAALQQIAKEYGERFTRAAKAARDASSASAREHVTHDIDFLMAHVIELEDGSTYGVEAYQFGTYEKYNNNSGTVFKVLDWVTPQAFSYFTFLSSNCTLMVVDVQGVGDLYTDPVIHFLPEHNPSLAALGDQSVNLGLRGFSLFLWSHRANPADKQLSLPNFPHALSEQRSAGIDIAVSVSKRGLSDTVVRENVADPGLAVPNQLRSPEGQNVVFIDRAPGVDLRLHAWRDVRVPAVYSEPRCPALPPSMVVAACHMEIAEMYSSGRLRDDPAKMSEAEAEAACFHLFLAAKDGLPEALLCLARMISGLSHEEFLPLVQCENQDAYGEVCIMLLTYVAESAELRDLALAARGSLATLLECGSLGLTKAVLAAEHYEKFAELANAEEISEDAVDPVPGLSVCTRHGDCFGWENHGVQVHQAYAKAAEHWASEKGPTARARAKSLYESAAEVAMEACAMKQAMRYSQMVESLDLEEDEDEKEEAVVTEVLDFRLESVPSAAVQAFEAFAKGFSSRSEAFAELIKLVPQTPADKQAPIFIPPIRESPVTQDVPAQLTNAAPVDDDIWGMLDAGDGVQSTDKEKMDKAADEEVDEDVWGMLA